MKKTKVFVCFIGRFILGKIRHCLLSTLPSKFRNPNKVINKMLILDIVNLDSIV